MRLNDRTLRAIGQDLEAIDVIDFDLSLEGEKCLVFRKDDSADSPDSLWKIDRENVVRTYRCADIDELVRAAETLRAPANQEDKPDLHSVAEMLRVLAAYCEVAGLEPVRVSRRGNRLRYEYQSDSAEGQVEERSVSDLHRFAEGLARRRAASVSAPDRK